MRRTPEPAELMDGAEQARAYAEADFSASNRLFVDLFGALHPSGFAGRAVDLGCGPGDIPLRFLRRYPNASVDGVDGAQPMLDLARQLAGAIPDLAQRLRWVLDVLPSTRLEAGGYDAVLSNSLLHHLADPQDLWRAVRHCGRAGAAVLVMDLARPDDEGGVEHVLAQHAVGAAPALLEDFRNSLHAAYTLDEVRAQLAAAGLDHLAVAMVSDRHLAVSGFLAA